jgi:chromosomal replication initiator protein
MVVRINDILATVAEYYNISLRDLLGRSRLIELARPRQVAMYLATLHTRKSHSQIAREFSKDHTTVIHALRRIEELIKHDDELAEDILFLTQQLSHRNAA